MTSPASAPFHGEGVGGERVDRRLPQAVPREGRRFRGARLSLEGWVVCVALSAAGCGAKSTVQAGATALEEAFPTAARASGKGIAASPASADALVAAALAAMRTNDLAFGLAALDAVTQAPGVTPEQLAAVGQARQAWVHDLVERAAAGDASAQAALAARERNRSQ